MSFSKFSSNNFIPEKMAHHIEFQVQTNNSTSGTADPEYRDGHIRTIIQRFSFFISILMMTLGTQKANDRTDSRNGNSRKKTVTTG